MARAMPTAVNADRRLPALMHGARLQWRDSPVPGVQRRLLERVGGEVALATSLVRYAEGSHFDAHRHDLGEEFLVLSGVFSDEHGHFPQGCYVRNPPGSQHRPFSVGGCVLFVKLRQMPASESAHQVWRPDEWARPVRTGSWHEVPLFANETEQVCLAHVAPGGMIPARNAAGGEEIFVLEGSLVFAPGPKQRVMARWSWSRWPGPLLPAMTSRRGALLWIKRGHLPAAGRTPCTALATSRCSNPSPA